jgi:hypothetical protein
MNKPKLVNGKIPAFTECPYKGQCKTAKIGQCGHFGKDHPKSFSCSIARILTVIDGLLANKKMAKAG